MSNDAPSALDLSDIDRRMVKAGEDRYSSLWDGICCDLIVEVRWLRGQAGSKDERLSRFDQAMAWQHRIAALEALLLTIVTAAHAMPDEWSMEHWQTVWDAIRAAEAALAPDKAGSHE